MRKLQQDLHKHSRLVEVFASANDTDITSLLEFDEDEAKQFASVIQKRNEVITQQTLKLLKRCSILIDTVQGLVDEQKQEVLANIDWDSFDPPESDPSSPHIETAIDSARTSGGDSSRNIVDSSRSLLKTSRTKSTKLSRDNRLSSLFSPLSNKLVATPKKKMGSTLLSDEFSVDQIRGRSRSKSITVPSFNDTDAEGLPAFFAAAKKERHKSPKADKKSRFSEQTEKSKSTTTFRARKLQRRGTNKTEDEDTEDESGSQNISYERRKSGGEKSTLSHPSRLPVKRSSSHPHPPQKLHLQIQAQAHPQAPIITPLSPGGIPTPTSMRSPLPPLPTLRGSPADRSMYLEAYVHPLLMGCAKEVKVERTVNVPLSRLDFQTDIIEDYFQTIFVGQSHYNYIGTEKEDEHFAISVLEKPYQGQNPPVHDCLKIEKTGTTRSLLTVIPQERPLADRVREALEDREGKRVYLVSSPNFANDLLEVEQKHPQCQNNMKLGVIYCKPGQKNPRDMLQNGLNGDTCSSHFWEFLSIMGRKIDLSTHPGYRGDFGSAEHATAYYDQWKDLDQVEHEIIYHVAPLLSSDAHRRLIGNDLGIIFYLEEGTFDISEIQELGTVPQVFAVVQPTPDYQKYTFACFSTVSLRPFGPPVPSYPVAPRLLRVILLTKFVNGLLMTIFCPPFNRLFYKPRGHTLETIIVKYPEKKEKIERKQLNRISLEDAEFDSGWYKAGVMRIIKGVPMEDKMPLRKDTIVRVGAEGLVVIDMKSKEKIYHWELESIHQWKVLPNDKRTLVLSVASPDGSSEAVSFHTSKASQLCEKIREEVTRYRLTLI